MEEAIKSIDFDTYTVGDTALIVRQPQDNIDHIAEQDVSFEEEAVNVSYEEGGNFIIDGVGQYAFGLWTKYLITSPVRVYEKPEYH